MGEIVEFQSNGDKGSGYFSAADGGGPAVLVIQEWWGLVPHIKDVCDRYAAAGFNALAPDLYRGATTTEPDEAGKFMMGLNLERAAKDLSGAVDFLLSADSTTSSKVGVTGFCMGGGISLMAAAQMPDRIGACAPYYGLIPWESAQPEWSNITAKISGHYAENDEFFSPELVEDLRQKLSAAGVTANLEVHAGADHAFFNDQRPEVYDAEASAKAWAETTAFLKAELS